MLRICIPVHNEATTIGVLLWRLRSVFQGFSREYDVTVYDDASTDGTAEVLEPYQSVMPLTVLRGPTHVGYAGSIDALVRQVAADDEYARRDAMVLLQGDFTESPEHLPELVKRFEGGADLVAVHRTTSDATPADERRLRRWGRWAVTPFLRMPPVADPFTGFRLVRISVLRELLKAMGNRPVCTGDGWAANIDFALNVAPFARRIENVEFPPRYDVRQRASRRRGWADVVALFHWARSARNTVRPAPGSTPSADLPVRGDALVMAVPAERARPSPPERERGDRGGRPERTRPPRDGAESRTPAPPRDGRAAREESDGAAEPARESRPPREGRNAREERALRGEERTPRAERPAREPRDEARPPRPPRPERPERVDPPVRAERAVAMAPSDDGERDDEGLEVSSPGAQPSDIADTPDEATTPAGEKKRRRRRRSRKDRSAQSASDAGGAAVDDGRDADSAGGGFTGTSEAGEGQQEDGSDESDAAESGESAESGAEGSRRKRRPRRRRRGRRSGGADAGAPDGEFPAPPAAEPPPVA